MVFRHSQNFLRRDTLPAIALVIPLAAYIFLGTLSPPQYPFVIQDAVSSGWPFFYSVSAHCVLALCAIWTLRVHNSLSVPLALTACSATAAVLWSSIAIAGMTLIGVLLVGAATIFLTSSFLLFRSDATYVRLPALIRTVWGPLIAVLLLYAACCVFSLVEPIIFPRALGAIGVFAIFIGSLSVLVCWLVFQPRIFAWTAAFISAALLLFGPNEHGIPPLQQNKPTEDVDQSFVTWLSSRIDQDAYRSRRLPYPVIFVSSEGGGIYAAAHAYGVLSTIANHCPTFNQHVFATIGVSGGAIGNALYGAAIDPVQQPFRPCAPSNIKVDPVPVITDHLSPVLARLLLVEIVDRLLPGTWMKRDRAQILADSFLSVGADPSYLKSAITDAFDPTTARPANISVAVDVSNGRRLVISPFQPESITGTGQWWPGGEAFLNDAMSNGEQISLIDGAGASARFPWITPTGRLTISAGRELTLADGGYFDNSGAETVIDLMINLRIGENWRVFVPGSSDPESEGFIQECDPKNPAIVLVKNYHQGAEWKECEIPVFVIHLALASREPTRFETDQAGTNELEAENAIQEPIEANLTQSFLFDPIRALLATRESRAEIALARASLELCGQEGAGSECALNPGGSLGFFRNDISPMAWKLPLGWHMPLSSFESILENTINLSFFEYRTTKKEAGSDVEIVLYHLDPSLLDEGADPNYFDLLPDP